MRKVKFSIPTEPRTKKNHQEIRMNLRTKKPYPAPSKQYREYLRDTALILHSVRSKNKIQRPIQTPVNVKAIYYMGNRNCNYFRCSNTGYAGAHFFVDRTGEICESVKLKYPAWSVGGGWMGSGKAGEGKLWEKCTNYNSISIELCDIATKNPCLRCGCAMTI